MAHQRHLSGAPILPIILAIIICAQLALAPRPARAAGVVGDGSPASCTEAALRAAAAGGGLISFNCGPNPVTITLTDEIKLSAETTIDGGGTAQGGLITLSGGGVSRILVVDSSARVTLSNLTFRDGFSDKGGALRVVYYSDVTIQNSVFIGNDSRKAFAPDGGGAISARHSRLTISNSHFEGNRGINGGAIYSIGTPLSIDASTFTGNDSTAGGVAGPGFNGEHGMGGAIFTDGAASPKGDPSGIIAIRNSAFRGNRSGHAGGAAFLYIYPASERIIIEGTVFADNEAGRSATGGSGGGALRTGNGPFLIRNSLFSGNRAASNGGALRTGVSPESRIENTTFVDNQVRTPDGQGQGGAIYVGGEADLAIVNSTLANNYADYFAGAIAAGGDYAHLHNSILAGNWANDGSRWDQCGRAFTRGDHNLQTPPRGGGANGNHPCAPGVAYGEPLLGELGYYGGPVPTVPLTAGSPAINAGAGCPDTDARGAARVGACDLGAFEFGATVAGFEPPDTPALASVTPAGPALRVAWAPVGEASWYEIAVDAGGGRANFTHRAGVALSQQTLVLGRGSYSVRVRACNNAGCSPDSEALAAEVAADALRTYLPLARRR